MPRYRIRNRSNKPITDGQKSLPPGGEFEFGDVCAAVRFVNGAGTSFLENTPGEVVQRINRAAARAGCGEQVKGAVVQPTEEGDPEDKAPIGGDSAKAQGSPAPVGQAAEVKIVRGAYGEPGEERTPAEALADPQQPASEGQVQQQAMAEGQDLETASQTVERGLRGDPPEGEERSTHTGDVAQQAAQGGDPVDLVSGRLALMSVDLEVPSPFFELALVRRYLSGAPFWGPFGFNWDHNWNVYLRELASGDVARATGALHEDVFRWDGSTFVPPRGVFELLERLPNQRYLVRARHGLVYLFERPPGWTDAERIPLASIRDRYGNRVELRYSAKNLLDSVEDDDGRGLRFFYGHCGILEAVEDHSGRRVRYFHDDTATHLIGFATPPITNFPDGILTAYEYPRRAPHPVLRHCITRIIDHAKQTVLENVYEADPSSFAWGRVVAQQAGGFVFRFGYEQLQWVPEAAEFVNVPAVRTCMVDPGGAMWTYTFNYRGDLLDERVRLARDGSFRVAITRREFDADGHLTALTLPDGSRTEWTYDSSNKDPRARANLLRVELRAARAAPGAEPRGAARDLRADLPAAARPDPRDRRQGPAALRPGPRARHARRAARGPLAGRDPPRRHAPGRGDALRVRRPRPGHPPDLARRPRGGVCVRAGGNAQDRLPPRADRRPRRRHQITAMDYDAAGHLSSWTAPGGATWRHTHNALGLVDAVEPPAIDGEATPTRYEYDWHQRLRRVIRPRGEVMGVNLAGPTLEDFCEYTPLGHPKRIIVGVNTDRPREWQFVRDWEGRPLREVGPDGLRTTRVWDERGCLLREILGEGLPEALTARTVYDIVGRVQQEFHADGAARSFERDPWGRVTLAVLEGGARVRTTWGPMDRVLGEDIEGDPGDGGPERLLARTRLAYDERGRLLRSTVHAFVADPDDAAALTSTRWHDADGLCVRREEPTGEAWSLEHDGLMRLRVTEDPLGNRSRVDFGVDGLPELVTDDDQGPDGPRSRSTKLIHDARGRLTSTLRPSGAVRGFRWDARDLMVEQTDPLGVITRHGFGLLGEAMREHLDPGGLDLVYSQEFDLAGRPRTATDPTGRVTKLQHDVLGRVRTVTLPDGGQVISSYDAKGRLAKLTRPDGGELTHTFDAAGRLATLEAKPGPGCTPVPKHSYKYDALGRLVQASAGDEVVMRRFDSLGRLRRDELAGRAFAADIDDLKRTSTFRFPDGREELRQLDALGRTTSITLQKPGTSAVGPASGAPGTVLCELTYLGPVRVHALLRENGAITRHHYDDEGRLTDLEHIDGETQAVLARTRLRHDRADRCRVQQTLPLDTRVHDFDARGRLTSVRASFPLVLTKATTQADHDTAIAAAELAAQAAELTQSWTLDGADTRLGEIGVAFGIETIFTYEQGPHHATTAVDDATLVYDADGRRTAEQHRHVIYDALGRVVQIEDAEHSILAQHRHDPLGRWSGGLLDGKSTRRFSFGEHALQEENDDAVVLRQATHDPAALAPVIVTDASGRLHLHEDPAANLVLITDDNSTPAERYQYDAFGDPTILSGDGDVVLPASTVDLGPRFGGMPYLGGPGLFAAGARHYDPITGVFLARDPNLHADSPSPYAYCGHNPVGRIDPDGALWGPLLFGVFGAAANVIGLWRSGADFDAWDVFAAGAIGFGAGFVGGATFGRAAAGITRGLLSVAGRAPVALGAKTSISISVGSGAGAGLVSGGVSGSLAGAAGGAYAGMRGGGDAWALASSGAAREGVAGMAAGLVGGALFQGSLRAGVLPSGTWSRILGTARRPPQAWGGRGAAVMLRGLASPAGLGLAGAGFASGFTNGFVNHLQAGGSWDEGIDPALASGMTGAALGLAASGLNPVTYQYWRARGSTNAAAQIQRARRHTVGRHHQRNVAQYPEHSTPASPNNSWIDNITARFTRGNVTGTSSVFPTETLHEAWHLQWGGRGTWSQRPSHGPWTPEINPTFAALPVNHTRK
jgi:RHS repeat-associated protein